MDWSDEAMAARVADAWAELTDAGERNHAGAVADLIAPDLEAAWEGGDEEAGRACRALLRRGLASVCGSILRRPTVGAAYVEAGQRRTKALPVNVATTETAGDGRRYQQRSMLLELTIPQFHELLRSVETLADSFGQKLAVLRLVARLVGAREWPDGTVIGDVVADAGLDIESFDLTGLTSGAA